MNPPSCILVLEKNARGKISSRTRWEYVVKNDVYELGRAADWKVRAVDRVDKRLDV